MKSFSLKKIVSLLVLGTLSVTTAFSAVSAANINTFAAACHAAHGNEQGDITVNPTGLVNTNAIARSVACSMTRSPLAGGANAKFFVDGMNFNGASTTCVLQSFDFNGTFLGSTSFVTSAATYDQTLTLSGTLVPTFAYVTLFCAMPGNQNGLLLGLTSVQ